MLENSWVDFVLTRGPIRGKDRNRIGLTVKVRARREVEDFMAGLANGRRSPVDAVADGWFNGNPEGGALEFYDSDFQSEPHHLYTLANIGGAPLIQRYDPNQPRRLAQQLPAAGAQDELVNLSFLRIAGISDESGITIGLSGPYSNEYVTRFRKLYMAAAKQFLHDYLVPITVNLHVIDRPGA
jgi:hypothetical protein